MHPIIRFVLEQILSDLDPDERLLRIHEHLETLKADLEAGRVPLTLLTITKQLTKNPEEYADKKSLPHVQVALRLNQHGGRKLKQGDTVTYIICEVRLKSIVLVEVWGSHGGEDVSGGGTYCLFLHS